MSSKLGALGKPDKLGELSKPGELGELGELGKLGKLGKLGEAVCVCGFGGGCSAHDACGPKRLRGMFSAAMKKVGRKKV